MHFRVCLRRSGFGKITSMRALPQIAISGIVCLLALAPARGQQLHCSPCNHSFGAVVIGSSASFTIQLTNTGNNLLRITAKTVTGPAYSTGKFALPLKLQPGQSTQLQVIFTPTQRGYAPGTITLTSNDPKSPLGMRFHGNGYYPNAAQLGVSPSTLNFGDVNVGSSSSLQATLTASNGAVTISSDGTTSSEYAIVGLGLPVTLRSGQSLGVTIQFTPNASGKASAQAGFTSNAKNSPTVEQLTGTGVAKVAHSVYLSWAAGDGNAVGYNVYRSTAANGSFQAINTALDASTNYTDSTVASGTTYYYVTTEVNAQGQESGYSNEVSVAIPNP